MSGYDYYAKWGKPFVNEDFFAPGAFRITNSYPQGRYTSGLTSEADFSVATAQQMDEDYDEVWVYSIPYTAAVPIQMTPTPTLERFLTAMPLHSSPSPTPFYCWLWGLLL